VLDILALHREESSESHLQQPAEEDVQLFWKWRRMTGQCPKVQLSRLFYLLEPKEFRFTSLTSQGVFLKHRGKLTVRRVSLSPLPQ